GFVVARNHEPGSTGKFQVEVPQGSGESIIVSPKRLKAWQPAYAMTVHKSQGSEYQRVGILLADYAKELLSRSLLYTGLTRAKQRCDIWADTQALEKAFLE
ncbi:ATP-binding domain-containing protein, partial [Oleiphilus sp. HI0086]